MKPWSIHNLATGGSWSCMIGADGNDGAARQVASSAVQRSEMAPQVVEELQVRRRGHARIDRLAQRLLSHASLIGPAALLTTHGAGCNRVSAALRCGGLRPVPRSALARRTHR